MSWTVILAKSAGKSLEKLPAKDRARIIQALRSMAHDPFAGDIVKLEGEESRWRRRVGNYRVFFIVDQRQRTVSVSTITRRTSTTY